MSMTKTFLPYYWIMVLACVIPLVLLLVMPNGMDKDAFYFALLSFAPVTFAVGVLLINWRKGKGPTHYKGER